MNIPSARLTWSRLALRSTADGPQLQLIQAVSEQVVEGLQASQTDQLVLIVQLVLTARGSQGGVT